MHPETELDVVMQKIVLALEDEGILFVRWAVGKDDFVNKGECRLETKSEIIDTDINYQFEEIRKHLSGK